MPAISVSKIPIPITGGGTDWSSYWTTRPAYFALPATGVSLMVGQAVTIYGDELLSLPIGADLTVTYTCDIGSASGNNYTINPIAGNIGDHNLRIVCVSNGITRVDETIAITVMAKNLLGSVKVLMIGDSTLDDGDIAPITGEPDTILDNNTITYVGTQGAGTKHEAYGGYGWSTFATGGPFFKAGVIDVPAYFTDNSIDTPNIVYFRLGVNTAFGYCNSDMSAANLATEIGYIDALVDAFLAHDANLRIILSLPTSTGDVVTGWNINYDEAVYIQDKYIEIIQRLREAMTARYANGTYDARVDCGYEQIYLNRNTGFLNGVHLNTTIGDIMMGEGLALELNKSIEGIFALAAEYKTVYSAMTTKPLEANAIKQNTCVKALKTGGVWSKLDWMYLCNQAANNDDGEALINWKTPGTYNGTLVNAPAFVAGQGFTGANTKYIRTNYNPSTAGGNYTQNSGSGGVWSLTDVDEASTIIGANENAGDYTWTFGMTLRESNVWNNRINQNGGNTGNANANSVGFHLLNRTAADYVEIRKNGTPITSTATASVAIMDLEIYLLCINLNGTAGRFATQQVAAAYMGGGFTAGEITAFYNALNTLFT